MKTTTTRVAAGGSLITLTLAGIAIPAFAQASPAPTKANASAPSPTDTNSLPLEPFLVTWLLPVAGILIAALAAGVDRSTRSRYRRGREASIL